MSDHKNQDKYNDWKYHKGQPHGCDSRTLLLENRKYARSRHAFTDGNHDWFVESRRHPGRWRMLDRLSSRGDDKDYLLDLKLQEAWEKAHTKSESDSSSAEAPAPDSDTASYSKFGLDRHGKEKFETVKLRKKNKLFFSYTLKEGKNHQSSGNHWLLFYIAGKNLRYLLPEEATWRFIKRSLMGLSQKLLLKAATFAKELYDERQKAGKK